MSTEQPLSAGRSTDTSIDIDKLALEQWLVRNVDGFEGLRSVQAFPGGQSNPTYKVEAASGAYVMRSKPAPAAKLLPSAHAIEREFRVMKALEHTDVPVPRLHGICEDETVLGRSFYVMDFIAGRTFWDQTLPALQPVERRAVYDEMNRAISSLHKVDPVACGLGDFGKYGQYFERQIARWTRQYLASATEVIPEMEQLIRWLPENLPSSATNSQLVCIVHGDYRLDNLLFDAASPVLRAVLDWELSTLGHPLADFSYHCMSWHITPDVFRGIAGCDLPGLGIPCESEYIEQYCERTGLAKASDLMRDWSFYLAYNMFRTAAILQGIAKRAIEGTASSAQAVQQGKSALPMAKLAWKYAVKAGA